MLSLITNLQVDRWGRELVVEGLDDPFTRRKVRLVFRVCRDIRWSNHEEARYESEADVVDLCLGQGDFREPAVITTDLFELTVEYGSREVESPQGSRDGMNTLDSVA
jgi:hypothetical protein